MKIRCIHSACAPFPNGRDVDLGLTRKKLYQIVNGDGIHHLGQIMIINDHKERVSVDASVFAYGEKISKALAKSGEAMLPEIPWTFVVIEDRNRDGLGSHFQLIDPDTHEAYPVALLNIRATRDQLHFQHFPENWQVTSMHMDDERGTAIIELAFFGPGEYTFGDVGIHLDAGMHPEAFLTSS